MRKVVGQRYGNLTVAVEIDSVIRPNGRRRRYFNCVCDCGGTKTSSWDNLCSLKISHCGCKSPRHGGYGTPLYAVWRRIKQCCFDTGYQAYHNYGARGIAVCAKWLEFAPFRTWALESGYARGLTLDRKDNNGNYCPENCRWVTTKEQNMNKRNNVWLTINGERIIQAEAAVKYGVGYTTLSYRRQHGLDLLSGEKNAV